MKPDFPILCTILSIAEPTFPDSSFHIKEAIIWLIRVIMYVFMYVCMYAMIIYQKTDLLITVAFDTFNVFGGSRFFQGGGPLVRSGKFFDDSYRNLLLLLITAGSMLFN